MTGPLEIALLSTWHVHATGYAEAAEEHPRLRLATVWDPDGPDGAAIAARSGARLDDDLDRVLDDPSIAGVVVTTPTATHTTVIARALEAGKHVFSEKLLAPTAHEAQALVDLAADRRRALVVSLPRLAEPAVLAVQGLVDSGTLGRITYARVRMAHDGWVAGWLPDRFGDPAAAIGGAMTDLGAHPVYLLQRLLGPRPRSIAAVYTSTTGHAVEDDAVVTATWPGGAIGVAEASFVTTPGAAAIEVRGTAGSVLHGLGSDRVLAKGTADSPDRWSEVQLPDADPTPFACWVDAIEHGADTTENLRAAVELSHFIEAANHAAAHGTTVRP